MFASRRPRRVIRIGKFSGGGLFIGRRCVAGLFVAVAIGIVCIGIVAAVVFVFIFTLVLLAVFVKDVLAVIVVTPGSGGGFAALTAVGVIDFDFCLVSAIRLEVDREINLATIFAFSVTVEG